MLAATKRIPGHLDILTLALDLLSKGADELPQPVQDHMWNVLLQAKRLSVRNRAIDPGVLPESANLALLMRSRTHVRIIVDEIANAHQVSQTKAAELLQAIS